MQLFSQKWTGRNIVAPTTLLLLCVWSEGKELRDSWLRNVSKFPFFYIKLFVYTGVEVYYYVYVLTLITKVIDYDGYFWAWTKMKLILSRNKWTSLAQNRWMFVFNRCSGRGRRWPQYFYLPCLIICLDNLQTTLVGSSSSGAVSPGN